MHAGRRRRLLVMMHPWQKKNGLFDLGTHVFVIDLYSSVLPPAVSETYDVLHLNSNVELSEFFSWLRHQKHFIKSDFHLTLTSHRWFQCHHIDSTNSIVHNANNLALLTWIWDSDVMSLPALTSHSCA